MQSPFSLISGLPHKSHLFTLTCGKEEAHCEQRPLRISQALMKPEPHKAQERGKRKFFPSKNNFVKVFITLYGVKTHGALPKKTILDFFLEPAAFPDNRGEAGVVFRN